MESDSKLLAADKSNHSTLIGVGICIAGNISISLALNLQKLAHTRLAKEAAAESRRSSSTERSPLLSSPRQRPILTSSVSDPQIVTHPDDILIAIPSPDSGAAAKSSSPRARSSSSTRRPRSDKVYLRSRLWWAGLMLLNLGELGNFTAYGFSPASLVAPLGTVALVANCFWSPLILNEPFRRKDVLGIVLTIIGGVTVVYASKSSDVKLSPEQLLKAIKTTLFLVYSIISVLAGAFLAFLSRTPYGEKHVMVDLGLCAVAGGFTVLATKAFSSFLTLMFLDTFRHWMTYPVLAVLLSTALIQVNYINKALQRFDSKIVVPGQFCSFSLSAIVGSAILYRDFDDVDFSSFMNFVFGVGLSAFGVYLLTKQDPPPADPSTPVIAAPQLRPRLAMDPAERAVRARTLSVTMGGSQYLLAQSPGRFGSFPEGNGFGAASLRVGDFHDDIEEEGSRVSVSSHEDTPGLN
ncbi:DUF803-domain-containing protein [Meredithblackwellia eburnea MCA 4105]